MSRKDTGMDNTLASLSGPLSWIGFSYAVLVVSGGITGYAKPGSVPSLAAGLGAYQLSQELLGLIVAASLLMVVAKFGISVLNRSHQ
ncbi:unnamed protein product [Nyctereutes procyonoides]|uniref:(raccoon dog) hypothetical protein n=1 Tax=Nyctereutes procyonoides TaxID=34880 RepID=A0A811YIP8_NYCPR|nr:unnamed protein product [Nyctereutes procyonoides]